MAAMLDAARHATPERRAELASLAASSGRFAVNAGNHDVARHLLQAALELSEHRGVERARLLLNLARATAGSGDLVGARTLLDEVATLAETAGDVDLLVDAAIRSTFPADWRAGDRHSAALLDLAERLDDGARRGAILACRALVEMRIPASSDPDQQVAWVTRASVAQPLADEALAITDGRTDIDRLLALISWRATHRAPRWLARRRATSAAAVDLAQRLLDHERLVDACSLLAVDCLETGDRSGYGRALATLRWAAATEANPRLLWLAATLSAGEALLDDDMEAAEQHRTDADRIGDAHDLPGWVAAELLFAAEMTLGSGDAGEMRRYLVPDNSPILDSPIARSSVAFMSALLGDDDRTLRYAETALRDVDEESSLLLCLVLLARAAATLGSDRLITELTARLEPWRGHVAIDASGWWCAGPVDLVLAEMESAAGRTDRAAESLAQAVSIIEAIGDRRSARRADELRRCLGNGPLPRPTVTSAATHTGLAELTDRERDVLRLIATGMTNAAIGSALAYSPSTIRADTVSIYRKLEVRGRAEAAAVAVAAGLTQPG